MLDVNGTSAASDVDDWRSGRLVGRRYPKQYNVASTTNIAVIFHAGAGRSTELPGPWREWDKKPYKILDRQKVADNWSLVTETSYISLFLSGASLGVTGVYPTLDWLKTNTNFNDKR